MTWRNWWTLPLWGDLPSCWNGMGRLASPPCGCFTMAPRRFPVVPWMPIHSTPGPWRRTYPSEPARSVCAERDDLPEAGHCPGCSDPAHSHVPICRAGQPIVGLGTHQSTHSVEHHWCGWSYRASPSRTTYTIPVSSCWFPFLDLHVSVPTATMAPTMAPTNL